MSDIKIISQPMTVQEAIVRSSIPILAMDSDQEMPSGFGTGFILVYQERTFLVTVFHVIRDGKRFFLETTQIENRRPYLKEVGEFCHFNSIQFKGTESADEIISAFESGGKKLDLAFTEIKPPLDLNQNEIDYGAFKVNKGNKIFIGMESVQDPKPELVYGFSGNIQQRTSGTLLYTRPTFKYGLTFHRTAGPFHIFIVPEPLISPDEYEGCSGAPIFDEDGKLVGIAAHVRENTKMLYAFSMSECKKLLDLSISTGML